MSNRFRFLSIQLSIMMEYYRNFIHTLKQSKAPYRENTQTSSLDNIKHQAASQMNRMKTTGQAFCEKIIPLMTYITHGISDIKENSNNQLFTTYG